MKHLLLVILLVACYKKSSAQNKEEKLVIAKIDKAVKQIKANMASYTKRDSTDRNGGFTYYTAGPEVKLIVTKGIHTSGSYYLNEYYYVNKELVYSESHLHYPKKTETFEPSYRYFDKGHMFYWNFQDKVMDKTTTKYKKLDSAAVSQGGILHQQALW